MTAKLTMSKKVGMADSIRLICCCSHSIYIFCEVPLPHLCVKCHLKLCTGADPGIWLRGGMTSDLQLHEPIMGVWGLGLQQLID